VEALHTHKYLWVKNVSNLSEFVSVAILNQQPEELTSLQKLHNLISGPLAVQNVQSEKIQRRKRNQYKTNHSLLQKEKFSYCAYLLFSFANSEILYTSNHLNQQSI
jgi:hypothetical protein